MASHNQIVLIADIGGTNARFGLVDAEKGLHQLEYMPTNKFASLTDAATAYLETYAQGKKPETAILSIAGPVDGDLVNFTNLPWSFRTSRVRGEMGLKKLRVMNDFEAVAYAIPDLKPNLVRQIGHGTVVPDRPIAVIGPGTGLGVASLVYANGAYVAVPGEGGHVTMPATTPREFAIFEQLRVKYHHISAERVCSGKGLENLYNAIRVLDGRLHETDDLTAADISARATDGTCTICTEALDLMLAFLGRIAGNLALTLMAKGGVYIAGGIPVKLGQMFDTSRFYKEYTAKGRMSDLVETIPVFVAMHETLGLLGLETLAKKDLKYQI